MRILHTSDWHLGHSLHGQEQSEDHAAFLAWLLTQIEALQPDAVLITGDVYETTTPPIAAERAFFAFLADAARARPGLQTVVLAGNHDSPARLAAPSPLLERWGVRVVASTRPAGEFDPEELVVPLRAADAGPEGPVKAWLAAVPFVRPADVPSGLPYAEGAAEVHRRVLEAARARRKRGQAVVVAAHGTLCDAERTADSERPVAGGKDALPRELFDADVSYVALGHLHRAQAVGRDTIRYAGSPIPLSFAEVGYDHQVLQVDLRGKKAKVEALPIPQTRTLLRVPADGPRPLPEVLEQLRLLPAASEHEGRRPWLDVRVELGAPEPDLRRLVDEALADRAAQLIALKVSRPRAASAALPEAAPQARLHDLAPLEVFQQLCARALDEAPSAELSACFEALVQEAQAQEREPLPDAPAEAAPAPAGRDTGGWTAKVRAPRLAAPPRTAETHASESRAAAASAPARPAQELAQPSSELAGPEPAPEPEAESVPEPGAFGPLFGALPRRPPSDREGAA
ncbi:MAG: exonuclease SbcCD subunit D C-terminal domain-containing protein [Planctomycetes bacterium]|nr:exonuclease SbcCD subunit D C-terminal domain-containing protein [Planctomycetota bacterium]